MTNDYRYWSCFRSLSKNIKFWHSSWVLSSKIPSYLFKARWVIFHDKPRFGTLFSYNDCSDFPMSACRLCPLCKTVVNIKRVAMKHICVSSNGSKVIVVTQVRILRTIKGMDWKRGPKRQYCWCYIYNTAWYALLWNPVTSLSEYILGSCVYIF